MRRQLVVALVLSTLLAGAAVADSGVGAPPAGGASILKAAGSRSLAAIGDDAFRFSSAPALGGTGFVVEIHPGPGPTARGDFIILKGHPHLGWRIVTEYRFLVSDADYAAFMALVDARLAAGDPAEKQVPGPGATEIVVCTDGPGYLTERRTGGVTRWQSGFCDDQHPNRAIARALVDILPAHLRGKLEALVEP